MERRGVLPGSDRAASFSFREAIFLVFTTIMSLAFVSCAQVASVTGEPVSQSKIVLTPNAINFSSVPLGQKNSQTVKIANDDIHTVEIKSIHVTGAGMSISRATFPFSLAPQESRTFNVEFAPKLSGAISGTLTVESNLPAPEILNVKGVGTQPQPKVQFSPASINFGKLQVKATGAQTVKISNDGNTKVTVKHVRLSGPGFAFTELPSKFELAPLQEVSFLVTFHPLAKGAAAGSLALVAKELQAPVVMTLAGDGVDVGGAPSSSNHVVTLNWDASPSKITGYHVYRGDTSGGPYMRLTGSPITELGYSDADVESGREYFYVATSVNKHGTESLYSPQISVAIPTP